MSTRKSFVDLLVSRILHLSGIEGRQEVTQKVAVCVDNAYHLLQLFSEFSIVRSSDSGCKKLSIKEIQKYIRCVKSTGWCISSVVASVGNLGRALFSYLGNRKT
jgi:hypothetical protein